MKPKCVKSFLLQECDRKWVILEFKIRHTVCKITYVNNYNSFFESEMWLEDCCSVFLSHRSHANVHKGIYIELTYRQIKHVVGHSQKDSTSFLKLCQISNLTYLHLLTDCMTLIYVSSFYFFLCYTPGFMMHLHVIAICTCARLNNYKNHQVQNHFQNQIAKTLQMFPEFN